MLSPAPAEMRGPVVPPFVQTTIRVQPMAELLNDDRNGDGSAGVGGIGCDSGGNDLRHRGIQRDVPRDRRHLARRVGRRDDDGVRALGQRHRLGERAVRLHGHGPLIGAIERDGDHDGAARRVVGRAGHGKGGRRGDQPLGGRGDVQCRRNRVYGEGRALRRRRVAVVVGSFDGHRVRAVPHRRRRRIGKAVAVRDRRMRDLRSGYGGAVQLDNDRVEVDARPAGFIRHREYHRLLIIGNIGAIGRRQDRDDRRDAFLDVELQPFQRRRIGRAGRTRRVRRLDGHVVIAAGLVVGRRARRRYLRRVLTRRARGGQRVPRPVDLRPYLCDCHNVCPFCLCMVGSHISVCLSFMILRRRTARPHRPPAGRPIPAAPRRPRGAPPHR